MTLPFIYGLLIGFLIGMTTFTNWAIHQHRKSNNENANHTDTMLWALYVTGKEQRVKANATN